jgi:hypothetical protein
MLSRCAFAPENATPIKRSPLGRIEGRLPLGVTHGDAIAPRKRRLQTLPDIEATTHGALRHESPAASLEFLYRGDRIVPFRLDCRWGPRAADLGLDDLAECGRRYCRTRELIPLAFCPVRDESRVMNGAALLAAHSNLLVPVLRY